MTQVEANSIQIEYETFGEPDSPALLLIIGIIGQLTFWDEKLCQQLAQQGHYVIRFDNRDAGLSSKIEEAGVPDIMKTIKKQMKGETIKVPYTIEDMADDAVGLLDALGIEKAHICGMSMGGMIAQTIAINYPKRVLSLISIYSNTGDPEEPQSESKARKFLLAPQTEEREAYIEKGIIFFSTISGPGFPYDEKWLRNFVAQSYDRAYNPEGVARQFVAILAQKNRRPELKSLSTPALIIHGADDPLVLVECGKNTAADIPGAELMIIDGMGHDLPHGGAWPKIRDAIAGFTQKIGA
ncbi:alpha/beta fold hydrolase [bacterium]|nr:alpha/beta fold hydrolase [bacterium]